MKSWNPPAEGTKEREQMPNSCFLDEKNKKYPYKELDEGKWTPSKEGLLSALHRAEQFNKNDIANKAKELLEKYFPKKEGKIMKKRLIRVAEENWNPDAVCTLTNNMAIGIKLIDGGDTVEYAYSNDNGWDSPQEAQIEYGVRGEDDEVDTTSADENQDSAPYFKTSDGVVCWVDDFIRTNY
jgi:hypothetical protein